MKRQYLPQEKLNHNTTREPLNLHFHQIAGIPEPREDTMIDILLQYSKFSTFFSFILTDDTGESKSKKIRLAIY